MFQACEVIKENQRNSVIFYSNFDNMPSSVLHVDRSSLGGLPLVARDVAAACLFVFDGNKANPNGSIAFAKRPSWTKLVRIRMYTGGQFPGFICGPGGKGNTTSADVYSP